MIKFYFYKSYIFKSFLLFYILISTFNCTYSFDPNYYINKYPDIKKNQVEAFVHYINEGFYQNRECAAPTENTNFDWQYYVKKNNLLNIQNKVDAINHYQKIGKNNNLEYCTNFNIGIFAHIYDLEIAEEFIEKINYFIAINRNNKFHIKITIPISDNIEKYKNKIDYSNFIGPKFLNSILVFTPYHRYLINSENYPVLYAIYNKLRNSFKINANQVQIIFTENRGADIGGFLLTMDQIIKQHINIDYFVKIHTKSHKAWRETLTSILNLRINKILNDYDYIYTCQISAKLHKSLVNIMKEGLFKVFHLPFKDDFYHSSGTMFLSSGKLIDFFKPYSLLNLFRSLNPNDYFHSNGKNCQMEHQYEMLFGYLASHLNLKQKVVGLIKREKDHLI